MRFGKALVAAAAMVAAMSAQPASAAWQEASSRHFVVYSDDTPDAVRAFTDKLERFDAALRLMRATPDETVSPLSRVTVYVVNDIAAVQKLAGRGGADVAGFYVPRASGPVAFVPRRSGDHDLTPFAILLHEYSHHFMFSNWGSAAFPAWLSEGFAEFNATATFDPAGSVTFGMPPLYRAYGLIDDGVMPVRTLLVADPNKLTPVQSQVFYGRSWLLLHYMTMDRQRRDQLASYFKAVNEGQPAAECAKLLGDPVRLDKAMNAYIGHKEIAVVTTAAASIRTGAIAVRPLGAGEAAIMPALVASRAGVDRKSALRIAALARKLGAPFPADPAVQNELAEAEFDAGDPAAAQAAADRALAADPRSVHALVYEGMSRAAQAQAAKATDPARWATVRSWYSRANHVDPEYALPLMLFYGSFRGQGEKPSANAVKGLIYARALAPYDPDLGLSAAVELLRQGKGEEAGLILKPIASSPHAGVEAGIAGKLLGAMAAGGADGGAAAALAIVDAPADDAGPKAAAPAS